jgi:hypothetical protein
MQTNTHATHTQKAFILFWELEKSGFHTKENYDNLI